jgi:hypothetical protein
MHLIESKGREWGFLCVSRFPMVFLVRRSILRSVHLKMLVMHEVSLPIHVKLAHL